MTNNKKKFREQQIKNLTNFSKTEEYQLEVDMLYEKLSNDTKFIKAKTIGITISMGFEMDTDPIIKKCLDMDKMVYIPKTDGLKKTMNFIKFFDYEHLEKTKFGVLEPKYFDNKLNPPDLMIVPGLAFTKDNYRLGFGAGFYDRYLRQFPTETISLATSKQIVSDNSWEIESHDVPVNEIISVR